MPILAGMTVEILKSGLGQLTLPAPGLTDELPWPISPEALLTLYRNSPEHARALNLKAEGCCGLGVAGRGAPRLEALCPAGAADLFVDLMLDWQCYGNAFLQLIKAGEQITSLRRLPARHMVRTRAAGYRQRLLDSQGQERLTRFKAADILHLRPPCPAGGYYALPSWIGARGMLELAQAAVDYNDRFFKNHALPEYAVISKGESALGEAEKQTIQEFFKREYQGPDNSHRTLYLHTSGMDADIQFQRITAETKDGDFIKLMDAARERIIAAHGVPPRLMSIAQSGQLGGGGEVQQQFFLFESLTLKPLRRRLQDQLQPLLRALGIARDALGFVGQDLTPPGDDLRHLAEFVREGILTPAEARDNLPHLAPARAETPKAQQKSREVSRETGQDSRDDPLIALLERL